MNFPVIEHVGKEMEYVQYCTDQIMESVKRYGKRSKLTWEEQCEVKLKGTSGEIAFFKYIQFPFKLIITKGGDKGDVILNGRLFDIKTSGSNHINVDRSKWGKFTGYIGMKSNSPYNRVEVLGAIPHKIAVNVANYHHTGYDWNGNEEGYYSIRAEDLYRAEDFLNWIRKKGNRIEYPEYEPDRIL